MGYIKHLMFQKAEREMAFPVHCHGNRKASRKEGCAATAPGELLVLTEQKPQTGEEGSLERRGSNSQVREALASNARSTRSSSRVMSELVTHKAFPFSAQPEASPALRPLHRIQPPLQDLTHLFLQPPLYAHLFGNELPSSSGF